MTRERHEQPKNRPDLTVVRDSPETAPNLDDLRRTLAEAGVPKELLRAIDNPEVAAGLREMIEAGGPEVPEDPLEGIMDNWRPLLEPDCGAFEAELAGCEFLGLIRATAPEPELVPEMLTDMVAQAEEYAKPESLAMLRVLAVHGPVEVRQAAIAAGDRLVSSGLEDPPWAATIGRPQRSTCFGYGDDIGCQEMIAITFRYARERHAIAVLIDHDLGGGVKDCWPSDQPSTIRRKYRAAGESHGIELNDYSALEAKNILDGAVGKEPCPVEPDQAEDVRAYLPLLRHRVALLG